MVLKITLLYSKWLTTYVEHFIILYKIYNHEKCYATINAH